jgi:hypothetical protein
MGVDKDSFSGCTDGKMVKVAATSSPGTTIHTAVAGTTAGTFDEIWLYATNNHTTSVTLTIQWGGTATPDDDIVVTLDSKSGLRPIIPGLILQNGAVVRAYASVANVICVVGHVNAITG